MKNLEQSEDFSAEPLTRERILALATEKFPRWREDIQERFVLELAFAVIGAMPVYTHPPSAETAPAYTRDFGDFATEDVMRWVDAELERCDAPMSEGLPYIPTDQDVGDALRWLRANLYGIKACTETAPVREAELPPLPYPLYVEPYGNASRAVYSERQMREYARAAIAGSRP